MCRIAGFWSLTGKKYERELITRMRDTQIHGGPDDAGIFIDESQGVYFGHRRLSIIDLSSGGHQPMTWEHLTIVFNGEIYNYQQIRKELQDLGYVFDTGSDTEVILKAFDKWKLDSVQKFTGMFAFVIWNSKEQKMYLCRDRMGVKPLYYFLNHQILIFSSELRGIVMHPDFRSEINHESVRYYLRYGYIPSPRSIFRDVGKLNPGNWMIVSADGRAEQVTYWSLEKIYESIPENQPPQDETLFLENCETLITDACNLRMIADVPVGLFLSGGIDSTLITTLLQRSSGNRIKTFTIGFEDKEYDESVYARKVASFLGTEHREFICTAANFIDAVRQIPRQFDEPFGDSSCIPAFMVASYTRNEVTVALSADGGDEVFGGYTKYYFSNAQYQKLQRIPGPVRSLLAASLQQNSWNQGLQWLNQLVGSPIKYLDSRLYKFAEALDAGSEMEFLGAASANSRYQSLKTLGMAERVSYTDMTPVVKKNHLYSLFTLVDAKTYLEGDILTKVDRTSMHTALEAREPLLDHRLVELMMQMPDEYKIRNGTTKWALRSILEKYVPKELYTRPKQGFAIPLNEWLKTHFKKEVTEMSQDIIFAETFRLEPSALQKLTRQYLEGQSDKNYHLVWFLFMLHLWYREWIT